MLNKTSQKQPPEADLLYLSVDLMQPVLDGSFHVLLPVGESQRDAVSSRDDGHHFTVCALPDERIQRNHLDDKQQRSESHRKLGESNRPGHMMLSVVLCFGLNRLICSPDSLY